MKSRIYIQLAANTKRKTNVPTETTQNEENGFNIRIFFCFWSNSKMEMVKRKNLSLWFDSDINVIRFKWFVFGDLCCVIRVMWVVLRDSWAVFGLCFSVVKYQLCQSSWRAIYVCLRLLFRSAEQMVVKWRNQNS